MKQHFVAAFGTSSPLGRLTCRRATKPIDRVKAENRFGMQRAQTRPDLVKQQLPDLSIGQSGESLCQRGGDQQGPSEPFHGVVRVHKLSLLFDEFPDGQFLSPVCSLRRGWKDWPEIDTCTKIFLRKAPKPDFSAVFSVSCERGTMAISDDVSNPGYMPLRVSAEGIRHLSSLTQFHPIADNVLIRLAERRTRLTVPDRWVAIVLILGNRIPVPVPLPHRCPQGKPSEATAPAKLVAITGGRIAR